MIREDLTEEEFQAEIKKLDPAHRVLARIERAKQQMLMEQEGKDRKCSGFQSSSVSVS